MSNNSLFTMKGFFDRFYELMSEHPDLPGCAVFDMVNEEHHDQYGIEKYVDYNSFKASKSRYFKILRLKRANLKQKVNNVNHE